MGTSVVTDEGRVNKFKRRFAGLDSLAAVQTMSSFTNAVVAEVADAKQASSGGKAKGKGKKK
jgi:hypothetical protein